METKSYVHDGESLVEVLDVLNKNIDSMGRRNIGLFTKVSKCLDELNERLTALENDVTTLQEKGEK